VQQVSVKGPPRNAPFERNLSLAGGRCVELAWPRQAPAQSESATVMVRVAYALGGGLGSGLCVDEAQLVERCGRLSPIAQVIVEKCLVGRSVKDSPIFPSCVN
jgi:carbamoylphosphate synthase large subunit